ncbi:hypothetical protein RhiirA5_351443 [Rhizophagus irregularis]|uniref:Uncharacterized protein n=2 Tax=Rhizophagus irregularis TaxID=588596 RepID=A0A2I1G5W2_9GLOM|nr:hypothetical protein RirG_117480 [Rhizophagus irregularis DAOM 197198w]PKC13571.1 hypothetical protein RhiirA5_351443 [Rhizophagus irregularis]GBC20228.1 hypothetical protein GLOIN_2v1708319 [Rhizophagus irregularis DAOM 181602=DAOM 197198]PKC70096.1 hypothetical protein RhiirA1_414689 [Rhizophagus irregularis]PKY42013.1 hypothetical protein RhiirA4_396776 [Rhizophagus irregularis]
MSSNPLENNIQLLRTSLNAIYGRTSNIIEHRATQAHLSQRQASYEPSKEDLDALESLKTQFHIVCDEIYLSLQNTKKVFLREYHENFEELILENKHHDEAIAEKMKIQNEKIALLRKALELNKFSDQNDKMDES